MKLVCIGDSLTRGFEVRRDEVWTALLQRDQNIEVVNRGINGDTTGGMLARFQRDVLEEKPSHGLIMGGINDLIMGAPLGGIMANLMAMLHQAAAKGIVPIMGIPISPRPLEAEIHWSGITDFKQVAQESTELRNQLLKLCKAFRIQGIDFYLAFQQVEAREPGVKLYLDGLHPTVRGNQMMAEAALREIRRG